MRKRIFYRRWPWNSGSGTLGIADALSFWQGFIDETVKMYKENREEHDQAFFLHKKEYTQG